MPIDSPLALLLVLLTAYLVAIPLLQIPFFRRLHAGSASSSRFPTLDGYRGYLALCVVVCHSYLSYFIIHDGNSDRATSFFFPSLGKIAVAQFFLITGFLFWGKALDKKIKPVAFYLSRVFRLGPLYLAVAVVLLALVAVETRFRLHESIGTFLSDLVRLFSLGAFTINVFNGVDTSHINGVRWTLHYEWVYYLLLPVLAIAATHRRFLAVCATVVGAFLITQLLLLTHLLHADRVFNSFALWLFLGGMAAAHITRILPNSRLLRSAWLAPVLLALAWAITTRFDAYGGVGIFLNILLFIPIACGNSLLGLLNARPSRLLSTISYSIYLLHPFILYALRALLLNTTLSPLQYWAVICLATIAIVSLCALAYRVLEHPFMHRKSLRPQKAIALATDPPLLPIASAQPVPA